MVRIISCHHFGGQKIGKCEEVLQLTVADDYIVVAHEHQVAIYSTEIPIDDFSFLRSGVSRQGIRGGDGEDIGSTQIYFDRGSGNSNANILETPGMSTTASSTSVNGSFGHENSLKFSHSFPTVDLIDFISYNRRGNYLLCLEKREATNNSSSSAADQSKKVNRSIRIYFNWDNATQGKPMKARIAGLVSPVVGNEPDEDTLLMVEIPPPPTISSPNSPANATGNQNNTSGNSNNSGSNVPNIVAVASCNILGHLASLTDTSTVHIYSFKLKDGKGRGRTKSQYADFDFSYTVEVAGFNGGPERCRIHFLANIIALSNKTQASIFRVTKHARNRARSFSNDSGGSNNSGSAGGGGGSGPGSITNSIGGRISAGSNSFNPNQYHGSQASNSADYTNINNTTNNATTPEVCDKVVFDPKNESIKVYLNTIVRANQKRKFPDSTSGVFEEYQEEIAVTHRSRLVFSAATPALIVEDLLRVCIAPEQVQSQSIIKVGLYAIKIKDDLGGVSCIVGTSSQAFVYHLPVKRESIVSRVVIYPLTAPLVSFAFDSMFFHALTETGLETYTSRSLYFPIKEFEGIVRYVNDCPFQNETPSLVGIRPFISVRHMAANELLVCLLASPKTNSMPTHSTASNAEDNLWTIYALQLPDIEMLYEDMSKAALQAKASNPEAYTTLMTELHLVLRSYMNLNPEMEGNYLARYRETCKVIGIEFFRNASVMMDDAIRMSDGSDKQKKESQADDLLDKGVTYLNMSQTDLKSIFEEDHKIFIKDKKMNRGVTRYINVMLPKCVSLDSSCKNTLSPKLASAVTEFLLAYSPESLVNLVINVPVLRESNSAKLLQILRKMAEASGYKTEESLALLLTLVTMTGCDQTTRSQVKEILDKCQAKDLENSVDLNWLMDRKTIGKPKIMDLTVCLSSAKSFIPVYVVSQALKSGEITVGQVMMAFSQGINLNAETSVQQSLTRTLTHILEEFFVHRLKQLNTVNTTNHILQYYPPYQSQQIQHQPGGGGHCLLNNTGSKQNQQQSFPHLYLDQNIKANNGLDSNGGNSSNSNAVEITLPSQNHHNLQQQKISAQLLQLTEDETRAIQALVRSYLGHINLQAILTSGTSSASTATAAGTSGGQTAVAARTDGQNPNASHIPAKAIPQQQQQQEQQNKGHHHHTNVSSSAVTDAAPKVSTNPRPNQQGQTKGDQGKNTTKDAKVSQQQTTTVVNVKAASSIVADENQQRGKHNNTTVDGSSNNSGNRNFLSEAKVTRFGKVPNFFYYIIKEMHGQLITGVGALSATNVSSFQVLSTIPMTSEDTREYFIKLSSLLASPLANAGGVKETILTFLDSKGQPGSALHVCLQMMAEPSEKAVSLLISKYPLAIMYYSKEMFGRSTFKWKILVSKLKEKIYSNSEDVDIYATIIESVYLYLANTLSPTELEEVLEKGEENSRFFKACRRTELANTYANKIVQMSNEYLK